MFLAYWPVLTLASAMILVSILVMLKFADSICRARHTTLGERDLSTYLPDSENVRITIHVFFGEGFF